MHSTVNYMYFYSLWSLLTGLISAHFLCFRDKKYRVWLGAQSTIEN